MELADQHPLEGACPEGRLVTQIDQSLFRALGKVQLDALWSEEGAKLAQLDLENRGELEQAGGLEYLATLANETAGAANARAYAKIIRERSMLRALINAGNEISGSAFATDGRTAAQVLDDAEKMVFEIAEKGSRGRKGFKALKDILPDAVDRIDELLPEPTTATS